MANVVWAVRHGQRQDTVDPDWETNAERVHDPELTDLGRWAAWRVGRRFAESSGAIDSVYASPFFRAVETADEICREIDRQFVLEPGLSEHRNADWFDADPETVPHGKLAEWFDTIRLDHDPQGIPTFPESHREAMDRIGDTAQRIVADATSTVLLVGHGITIGGVVQGLIGSTDGADAPLCGLTRIERTDRGWELAFSGDTTHLDQ